ncbi:MAG: hypothetical protein PHR45_09355 [Muribaculaceae bacterium]|nr:hypothetical protein [Muribaculaceae bacterium]
MDENSWRIDYGRLGTMLLPKMLRKGVMGKWVRLMMSGVAKLHVRQISYRDDVQYRLRVSGQVCRLRWLLNDKHDATYRRIEIKDVELKPTLTILWKRNKCSGLVVGKRNSGVAISRRGYEGIKQPDFEVLLPSGIDKGQITAQLNRYKLAGKRYILTEMII